MLSLADKIVIATDIQFLHKSFKIIEIILNFNYFPEKF